MLSYVLGMSKNVCFRVARTRGDKCMQIILEVWAQKIQNTQLAIQKKTIMSSGGFQTRKTKKMPLRIVMCETSQDPKKGKQTPKVAANVKRH